MSGEYEKAISIGKAIQNIVSRRYLLPEIQFERQVISVLLTMAGGQPNGRCGRKALGQSSPGTTASFRNPPLKHRNGECLLWVGSGRSSI